MSYSPVNICNFALAKLGGAGDQVNASGQITSLTDTDRISVWCNTMWPKVRAQVITDLAVRRAPIRGTVKMAELDDELVADDVVISDISVGAAPGYAVTVTTDEVHDKVTGDTVVLKGIDGEENIGSLNGVTYTITVVDTTSFTLDTTTGDADWEYTENSGLVSRAPELGPWKYAFDLPADCIAVVRVTDETFGGDENTRRDYRFTTILNRDEDGELILTNEITNKDGDGIYIEYAIDQDDSTLFDVNIVDAMATLLGSELAPVCGRNTDMRLALFAEYRNLALPDAAAFNQGQQNNTAKARTDFRGGRSAVLGLR